MRHCNHNCLLNFTPPSVCVSHTRPLFGFFCFPQSRALSRYPLASLSPTIHLDSSFSPIFHWIVAHERQVNWWRRKSLHCENDDSPLSSGSYDSERLTTRARGRRSSVAWCQRCCGCVTTKITLSHNNTCDTFKDYNKCCLYTNFCFHLLSLYSRTVYLVWERWHLTWILTDIFAAVFVYLIVSIDHLTQNNKPVGSPLLKSQSPLLLVLVLVLLSSPAHTAQLTCDIECKNTSKIVFDSHCVHAERAVHVH